MSEPAYSPFDNHPESSSHAQKSSSGLTLVLPSLSALRAQKTKKKIKLTYEEPVKKQPRPIKLKPLKEVLTKLIAQIKRKDDYAFFLQPVDLAAVPNYTDIIVRPMDLGTMTTKVEKGKYRSLEEFASDLKLVTTNAKTFNPPGTIYHTEAERIEAYALDQITKAAATVIEYETDWNIDVEKDDEPVNLDDDDGTGSVVPGTPMDVDESRAGSPSAMSMQVGGRKGKGKKGLGISETLEPDGGLPGAKDGLGAFPPGSEWAELMLALKLKGKRYRTKKERMRMERGGPPLAADGSLDYPEMEDPFSVLSAVVPEPMSRPDVIPVFPAPAPEPSTSTQPPPLAPIHILPTQDIPTLSIPSTSSTALPKLKKHAKPAKRRHWVVNHNALVRRAAKDAAGEDQPAPEWKSAREPLAADFGSYAVLPALLAEEKRRKDGAAEASLPEGFFEALRESLQDLPEVSSSSAAEMDGDGDERYWEGKAGAAQAYIRDVVYGGVDGYAYVRSLAEFLTPSEPVERGGEPTYGALGMPVARWVEENVVDPLTDGRHRVLRDAAKLLNGLPPTPPLSAPSTPPPSHAPLSIDIPHQIDLSLHAYPAAARALAALQTIYASKIDLAALLRAPDELFRAEDAWAGRAFRERRRREMDEALARDPAKNAAAYLRWAIEEHREAEASAGSAVGAAGAGDGTSAKGEGESGGTSKAEEAEMLAYALEVAADELLRLARGEREVVSGADTADGERGNKLEDHDGARPEPAPHSAAATELAGGSEPQLQDRDVDGDVVMKTEDEPLPDEGHAVAAPAAASAALSPAPSPTSLPPAVNGSAAPHGTNGSTAATAGSAVEGEGGADAGAVSLKEEVEEEEEDPVFKKLRLNLLALAKRAPLDQIMKLPAELVPAHLRHIVPTTDA